MHRRPPSVLVRFAHTTTTAWANGRGTTSELISWEGSRPLSAGTLPDWRLSIAQLVEEAAFSPLPGTRRLFAPVGTGVTLVVNGRTRWVADRTVTAFDGDDVVALVGLDPGPGHAVNLMYRATGGPATPELVVGHTDDAMFSSCLVAVAIGRTDQIDRFDVLAPGPLGRPDPGVPVVMVSRATRTDATDRPGR